MSRKIKDLEFAKQLIWDYRAAETSPTTPTTDNTTTTEE